MADWYLNRALSNFRAEVNARYPNRDKTSDGTIGDPAHQATNSDHNPDPDGSVDAWDMDVDLRSGDDAAAIEHLKQVFQAHESSRYWIHNRQIASRADGWVRRAYDGANAHTMHVHWNTRESHEASTAPWELGDDMTPEEVKAAVLDALGTVVPYGNVGSADRLVKLGWSAKGQSVLSLLAFGMEDFEGGKKALVELAALRSVIEQLAEAIRTGGGTVDTAAILAGVRDAVADLGEGGAAQVRAPQA